MAGEGPLGTSLYHRLTAHKPCLTDFPALTPAVFEINFSILQNSEPLHENYRKVYQEKNPITLPPCRLDRFHLPGLPSILALIS